MIVRALAALLACLTLAGGARAQLPTDRPLTGARITASLQIAEQFWQTPAPCDIRVYAATPAQLEADLGYPVIGATPAEAIPAGVQCPVWISDALADATYVDRILACSVIVHELGHRFGLAHDDASQPGSVMNGVQTPVVYGCYRRFLPRGQGAAWRERFDTQWATRPRGWGPSSTSRRARTATLAGTPSWPAGGCSGFSCNPSTGRPARRRRRPQTT